MPAVELIAAALAAGASAGVSNLATTAIGDAYGQLKALIIGRRPELASVIAQLDAEAAGESVWQAQLAGAIAEDDQALVAAAQRVLDAARPGPKFQVDAQGAQGVYLGDGGTQFNRFGS